MKASNSHYGSSEVFRVVEHLSWVGFEKFRGGVDKFMGFTEDREKSSCASNLSSNGSAVKRTLHGFADCTAQAEA